VPPGSPFVFRTGGSNPNVFADTAQDRLTGGNGNDWFMRLTTSITDRKSGETLTQLFTD